MCVCSLCIFLHPLPHPFPSPFSLSLCLCLSLSLFEERTYCISSGCRRDGVHSPHAYERGKPKANEQTKRVTNIITHNTMRNSTAQCATAQHAQRNAQLPASPELLPLLTVLSLAPLLARLLVRVHTTANTQHTQQNTLQYSVKVVWYPSIKSCSIASKLNKSKSGGGEGRSTIPDVG